MHEIKGVLRKKVSNDGSVYYYVNWKHHPSKKYNSWVNENDLSPELVGKLKQRKFKQTKDTIHAIKEIKVKRKIINDDSDYFSQHYKFDKPLVIRFSHNKKWSYYIATTIKHIYQFIELKMLNRTDLIYNIVHDDVTIDISKLENIPKYWHIISKYILFHSIMKAIKHDSKIYDKLINSKDYVIAEAIYGVTVYTNMLMICRAYISNSTHVHVHTHVEMPNDILPKLEGHIIDNEHLQYKIQNGLHDLNYLTQDTIQVNIHIEIAKHLYQLNNSL